jgi:membrane peptidoglycan carboxypeptidase
LTLLKREQPLDPDRGAASAVGKKAVRQVRAMLEQAVSQQGTGAKASVPGYRVAGKTGTVAQDPSAAAMPATAIFPCSPAWFRPATPPGDGDHHR